ncbi:hypothetical protein COD21_14295 [Bacillus cereus]|uniref:hypothetical protein n=1 Tax=Bacillus cereus TaxID=1396 RepID=UPI000BFB2C72|nr:hypothetical protein [Bacillus cereus]PGU10497.1 hypothetical protein COD21_14295 [Bacillus cereus]
MGNIIKRRHTVQYAQIHNNPLQHDLEDLRSIGLLSHLMSLPSDWVIYKTQLYKKFSRKNIDAAWKELAKKNYVIGFNCYIDGKRQSFYNVSDIPFISSEYSKFIQETILELTNSGAVVKSFSPMKDGNFNITEDLTDALKVQQSNTPKKSTNVPTVQYRQYSTVGTFTKELYTNKKIKKEEEDIIYQANLLQSNLAHLKIQEPQLTHKNNSVDDADIFLINNKVRNMFKGKIHQRSFNSVLKKCINNYKKGAVPKYENYLITAIENKIEELEINRTKRKVCSTPNPKVKKKTIRKEIVPKWLQEEKEKENKNTDMNIEKKITFEEEEKKLHELLLKYRS